MAYREIKGNIFSSNAQAIVNTVNCVGVMGKGIALEFRRRYPEMYKIYQQDCKEGKLQPGRIYFYSLPEVLILNFAIKNDWKYPSRVEWIESCLRQFVAEYRQRDIRSVAFPWMGAMNGGIPLEKIQEVTRKHLENLTDIEIEVYSFDPDANDPLFDVLKKISMLPNPFIYQKESGLQRKAYEAVINSVKQGRIKSLARLVESRIVGDISIDKLYEFLKRKLVLLNNNKNEQPLHETQLPLF